MTDLTYNAPRVELLAGSPRREMLTARLRSLGLRPLNGDPTRLGEPMALLVDLGSLPLRTVDRIARELAQHPPRPLFAIRGRAGDVDLAGAAVLNGDAALVHLPARLDLRRRQDVQHSERTLRAATLAEFGVELALATAKTPPVDLLYLGETSPRFLALRQELADKGHGVTAALSLQTARAHLAEERFGGVLIAWSVGFKPASAFLADIQTGSLWCNVPVIALPQVAPDNESAILLQTADEILDPLWSDADVARTIARVIGDRPALPPRRWAPPSQVGVVDPVTGLYREAFFRRHLDRQLGAAETSEESLSVMSLNLYFAEARPARLAEARLELARLVKGDLRASDLAARLEDGSLIVSLRATPYKGALRLAQRVAARFSASNASRHRALVEALRWRIVERRAHHSADSLIGSARAGPYSRPMAA